MEAAGLKQRSTGAVCAQIQANASKLIGQHFITQQENDSLAFQGDWPSQSPDFNPLKII